MFNLFRDKDAINLYIYYFIYRYGQVKRLDVQICMLIMVKVYHCQLLGGEGKRMDLLSIIVRFVKR